MRRAWLSKRDGWSSTSWVSLFASITQHGAAHSTQGGYSGYPALEGTVKISCQLHDIVQKEATVGAEFADLNITPMMPQEGQAGRGGHGEVEARQQVWRKEASHLRGKKLDIKRRERKEAFRGCLWQITEQSVASASECWVRSWWCHV